MDVLISTTDHHSIDKKYMCNRTQKYNKCILQGCRNQSGYGLTTFEGTLLLFPVDLLENYQLLKGVSIHCELCNAV